MTDLIVACVRTGSAYSFDYVTKMRNMVARHLNRPYTLTCLTDQPDRCSDVAFVDITALELPGWWGKMALFEPQWRGLAQVIYLDLDTVLIGDLLPLLGVPGEFGILASPVRMAGNIHYPCKYNSSVMTIGAGKMSFLWEVFARRKHQVLAMHSRYGDQAAIEALYPNATLLQDLLPKYFLNYRHLTNIKPDRAAVVNFGGSHKPDNCPIEWVKQEWA